MAIGRELKHATLGKLNLDPMNPRLGRHRMSRARSQDSVLEMMQPGARRTCELAHRKRGLLGTRAIDCRARRTVRPGVPGGG